jgi:peptide/nickel transport system permease protein
MVMMMNKLFVSITSLIKRISRSKTALCGMFIVGSWLLVMLLSVFWTPYNTAAFDLIERLQPPSWHHPFGTDKFGRDILSRVMAGSQQVVAIALSSAILALITGTVIGLAAGYFGGMLDEFSMRAMDILMSFPGLLLAILVMGMLGPGNLNTIMVIAIVFSPRVARVCRGAVLEVVTKEFVDAARARGASSFHMLFIEVMPNILGPLGVEFTVRFAYAIFLSASLGFLGLGVQPPTPDWGLMINEGRELITLAPWVVFFPGVAIASLVIGVNLLSDTVHQMAAGEI